ncbi:protein MIZU-KUSSEI 1 [Prunus yedoensis var. nudiflora]|uniref:Protein MIZU-KUSSEI 1 n=1 Tax=Prunus yedoensis var. nudiflora TaxID=2094558 RepID=A0A314ZAS4_PRUYE|nr:protein MIZU-KUSSEI 1 [Prunus yedoensis var. nudiflora]
MPSVHSSPFYHMENSAILNFLRHSHTPGEKRSSKSSSGGLLKMFKLFPMLTSGCKMVALLGRPRKPLLKDNATTGTIFGYRKGRVSLAIQEDPHCMPLFVIELPMHSSVFHKEMASDIVRIALESETKTNKKEAAGGVHFEGCFNGAGVLPSPSEKEYASDGELTYIRARFERVVGSKDSEALYMINPDGAAGPELSIFFVRAH